ncbi:glycosyltransferase [Blastococcus sp. TML/C7B]|uniref:glycosyltransferase family 4 protein n=1 Tax=Blastococcus sp. TML/C7B TaxID=2798728 RepID=UPI00190B1716|nr:glycosyltransferase family 4 protein [Blastococcus sp. TML/C7B]MBN1095199.1 glycosyltransferase [Blastococcus sp. TML/C7B]
MNENIGGHATVHHHLRTVAAERDDLDVRIIDVPPPTFLRKVAAVAVPGLARLDADLRSVRYQLAQSASVARQLPRWLAEAWPGERPDVVHLYTHNVGLLAGRLLREIPYVVTIDSTNAQSNLMHPAREPTRFSSWSTRAVRPFERRVYAQAHRVIANSAWCARSVREDYGIAAEKIEVVPMGVALPKLSRVGRGGRPLPRILFIGRSHGAQGWLRPARGPPTLVGR